MKRPGRNLTAQEAEDWARVARSVTPLALRRKKVVARTPSAPPAEVPVMVMPADIPLKPARKVKGRVPPPLAPKPVPVKLAAKTEPQLHLDGSWERRIAKGTLMPDFSLDLHGSNLESAYARLMLGLAQARAMGARVVLVVTGKARPVDAMDRGDRRGAIRAKIVDWLGASEHAGQIVAIRSAHRRHGGAGALYVVLRKSQ
ncbi:Smr/MutS family protein [Novosphingobium sp. 9]|uniref:Smr/MutS family protein n=1 Tax=Novosphingobium sp. 9 TaxID=2025349 RepID=UPI0021B682CA|nr:Smr/MutS family protein [Novosphingobium sp. 9]